jgi:SAM-dependent methyltransferase
MSRWLGFWESANRIYVNERHRAVHYRQVADDILAVLPSRAAPVVLDYGCGEALEAGRVAERAARLFLFDAAKAVRERTAARFSGVANIAMLDDAGLAALAPGSLDLIVVNSVLQYVRREDLPGLLVLWRRLLKAGGVLALADIVPPDLGMLADAGSLLKTAIRFRFLGAALLGLASTFFSDYRRLRAAAGLSTYAEAEMLDRLRAAGFDPRRRARNFGFNPARMTFLAERTN